MLDQACDEATIQDWVFQVPLVGMFLSVVVHRGLRLLSSSFDLSMLVPECHVDYGRPFESILDVLAIIYLNSHLAAEHRHHWRLLFSTQLHGQSFSQLCSHITHQGPCLLALQDKDGHIFGGFASCSWEVKPQFQGKASGWQWVLCQTVLTPWEGSLGCRPEQLLIYVGRPRPLLVVLFSELGLNVKSNESQLRASGHCGRHPSLPWLWLLWLW